MHLIIKILGLILISSFFTVNASVVKCENLRWKMIDRETPSTYRGSIKPGTADYIELEVRGSKGIIGQGTAYPNGGGNWQMTFYADRNLLRKDKERFYCHKY